MFLVLGLLLGLTKPLYAQDSTVVVSVPDSMTVSILTISPGSEIYSLFGHSAIRVKIGDQIDETYNYGTFDFKTPGFLTKFLRGKLPYAIARAPMHLFLQEYQHFQRGVYEQELNISIDQKKAILEFLENNLLPENKLYMYDFINDNCATRIRDVVQLHAGVPITYNETSSNEVKTHRNMLHEYLVDWPWTKFGIDLVVASRADKVSTTESQMFLPDYLQKNLGEATINDSLGKHYLLLPTKEILHIEPKEISGRLFTPFNLFNLIGCILILFSLLKWTQIANIMANTVFVILGIVSIVILFMWVGTDHQTTKVNYNLLWISPLYILLPFIRGKIGLFAAITLVALTLVCLFLPLPQAMPVKDLLVLILASLFVYIKQLNSHSSAEAI